MNERGRGNQTNNEVFQRYYPEGTIADCDISEVPKAVLKIFENKSRMFILPENYRPGNFSRFMKINSSNGYTTYAATQIKTYDKSEVTEEVTHLVDFNMHGEFVGLGEMGRYLKGEALIDEAYFLDKPYVEGTLTLTQFQRNGFGIRRLRIMNAISQMLYSLPMHSSGSPSVLQKRVWERLVQSKEAEMFKDKWRGQQRIRYRFV